MTTTENMKIQYIDLGLLQPHPQNPRTSLGDLTELAESIKEFGIKQPITAVRANATDYNIIMGHRRAAAAKLAGRTTVPVIVGEYSEREQIELMLLENIQRVDLTPIEEGFAFLQLMDLGYKEAEVADKIKKSASYVSKRVTIAKSPIAGEINTVAYDKEEHQLTFEEIYEIGKFENVEVAEKLLAASGTNNFQNQLRKAKQELLDDETSKFVADILKENGYKVVFNCGLGEGQKEEDWQNVSWLNFYEDIDEQKLELQKEVEGYIEKFSTDVIEVHLHEKSWRLKMSWVVPAKEDNSDDKPTEENAEELAKKRADAEAKAKTRANHVRFAARAEDLRKSFILSLVRGGKATHAQEGAVARFITRTLIGDYDYRDVRIFAKTEETAELLGINYEYYDTNDDWEGYVKAVTEKPSFNTAIASIYADLNTQTVQIWNAPGTPIEDYNANGVRILRTYTFLRDLGYDASDEELVALKDIEDYAWE